MKILLNIIGTIVVILGGLYTFLTMLWPITGNHGATWGDVMVPLSIGVAVTTAGLLILFRGKLKRQ